MTTTANPDIFTASPSRRERSSAVSHRWVRLVEMLTLVAYTATVYLTAVRHEHWGDEGQAWLLARDASLLDLFGKYLHYEGTPGLWHLILAAAQTVHLPFESISLIAATFAVVAAAAVLFLSPFPLPVRVLLPFTFFLVYQYAVVGRSYALLPPLMFLAAHFYRSAKQRPYPFAIVLALLAHVSLHGTVMAIGMAAAYAWSLRSDWPDMNPLERGRQINSAALVFLSVLLAVAVAYPASDAIGKLAYTRLPFKIKFVRALDAINGATTGQPWISAAVMAAIIAWLATRKRLELLLPAIGVAVLYGWAYGVPYHQGTIFVSLIAAVWAAWPKRMHGTAPSEDQQQPSSESALSSSESARSSASTPAWLQHALVAVLIGVCAWQIWWGAASVRNDLRAPYSGSRDAAAFLKSVDAEDKSVYGLDYGITAIQPYFPSNIFANRQRTDGTSFWHLDIGSMKYGLSLEMLEQNRPEFVVIGEHDKPVAPLVRYLNARGYQIVHTSDGSMFYKTSYWKLERIIILRRTE